MTENMTSDNLHDHKKECLKPISSDISMKFKDSSNSPVNILEKLEVIWPRYDRKCDLRRIPWIHKEYFPNQ